MKKFCFFLTVPLLIAVALLFVYRLFRTPPAKPTHLTLFTPEELSSYNGETNPKIYLSIIGRVFDVTEGGRHYGPGGSYHFFVGKDASRSFVSGQFTAEHLTPNISDFSYSDINSLQSWVGFYEEKYPEIGRLVGHFFDAQGNPTDNYRDYELKLKGSSLIKEKEKEFYELHPKCNMKWHINEGGLVWCDEETSKSGGVERGWIGVPRKYYKKPGSRNYECVCVKLEKALEKTELFRKYENCGDEESSCKY